MELAAVQRRTLILLFATQIISGVGVAIGASVGALLAADIAGVSVSGVAQSAHIVGAALFAVPATAIVYRHGRRPSLAAGYFVAAAGALIIVAAAIRSSIPLLFLGLFLFGGASAASLQARYAAVDLAPAALRGPSPPRRPRYRGPGRTGSTRTARSRCFPARSPSPDRSRRFRRGSAGRGPNGVRRERAGQSRRAGRGREASRVAWASASLRSARSGSVGRCGRTGQPARQTPAATSGASPFH